MRAPFGQTIVELLTGDLTDQAVGPVYQDGKRGEPQLLAAAHRRSLELAVELGCRSIAFPAISTGVYGYPLPAAAAVAIDAVATFAESGCPLELVRFVLYSEPAYQAYAAALERRSRPPSR